jgi:hypothetical protein
MRHKYSIAEPNTPIPLHIYLIQKNTKIMIREDRVYRRIYFV